ncbi:MAG: hypothetical protein ACLQKK_15570 [Rhodomicrobium sp.]
MLLAAAVTGAAAGIASAAVVTVSAGQATMDRGYGSRPVVSGETITPGTRIQAADGTAAILYSNGCTPGRRTGRSF